MFVKSKSKVGISISPRKVALAEVHANRSGVIKINRLSVLDIPPGAVDDNGVKDIEAVSKLIQSLLAANNIKHRKVSLAISAKKAMTHLIELPLMPESKIPEAINEKVNDWESMAGETPVSDFLVIDRKIQDNVQNLEILVAAAPKRLISSYQALAKSANLEISAIETTPLAMLRVLNDVFENPKIAMIVNMEEDHGIIYITQDYANIKFIHNVKIGSRRLTEDHNALESLASELKESLSRYHTASPESGKVEELILFMDSSDSEHISTALSGYLDIPILVTIREAPILKTANEDVRAQTIDQALSAYSVIGAAMRTSAGDKFRNKKNINLLMSQKPGTAGLRKCLSVFLVCLILMILSSICVNFALKAKINSMIKHSTFEEIREQQMISDSESSVAYASLLETQINMTKAILNSTRRVEWSRILQDLEEKMPKSIWLTDLSWEKYEGITFRGISTSRDSIIKYKDALKDLPYVDFVTLNSVKDNIIAGHSFIEFDMLCGIKG